MNTKLLTGLRTQTGTPNCAPIFLSGQTSKDHVYCLDTTIDLKFMNNLGDVHKKGTVYPFETDSTTCALDGHLAREGLFRINAVVFQFQHLIFGPPWFQGWQESLWGQGNAWNQSSSPEEGSFHVKSCLCWQWSCLAQEQRAKRDVAILPSQGWALLQSQFPQWHVAHLEKDCSRLGNPLIPRALVCRDQWKQVHWGPRKESNALSNTKPDNGKLA